MTNNQTSPIDRARTAAKRVPYLRRLCWHGGRIAHHVVPSIGVGEPTGTVPSSDSKSVSSDGGRTLSAARTVHEPLELVPDPAVENPVLTATDVTDYGQVDFVADPFCFVTETGEWHMFFEVYNTDRTPDAVIGHATSTDGGTTWEYDRVVLNTGSHLSFPYVFEWEGTKYMIPEEGSTRGTTVTLYEAVDFPTRWEPVATPISNDHGTDDTIVFRWEGRWWAIVGESVFANRLRVYHSESLRADDWTPHRANPVVTDRPRATRPAGRPIVDDDRLLVFYQDCEAQYGDKVRAFEITDLTTTAYADRELPESPVLEATDDRFGWTSGRMHHVDPWYTGGRWRCAVDGNIGFGQSVLSDNHWAIGIYTTASEERAQRR